MSYPREGSREIDEGIIVSEAMDWCNSPTEPVPYRIWAKQVQATDLANSVRQTDDRSHVKGSIVLASYGDEPGVGGGVISGTHNAECTPKTWSETVRAEGRNMVRHDDEWWMNHHNTNGYLTYVGDTAVYPVPAQQQVDPDLKVLSDAQPDPIRPEQQYARAYYRIDPLSPGDDLTEPYNPDETIEEWQDRKLRRQQKQLGGALGLAIGAGIAAYWLRTSKKDKEKQCPCIVGTYNGAQDGILERCRAADCSGQAHHIVADKYLGLGNRASRIAGVDRIKGMPSFDDGPAICLNGNAGSEDSDHNIAHQNDGLIEDLGNKNDPRGTLPIGVIHTLSVAAAKAAGPKDPDCQRQIEAKSGMDKYGSNESTLVRSSNMPPAEGSPAMNHFKPQKPIR